jgi:hypothetical protein
MSHFYGPMSQETKQKITEGLKKYWKAKKEANYGI